MNKELSLFDLDGTLWNINNDDIWIIDKNKPYKPIVTIDEVEFSLIKNGIYLKYDLPLKYNGQIYYISPEMFYKIKKLAKSENIERFGISFTAQTRKEILDKKELDVLIHNIEHLKYNKFMDIGLLTARSNQKNHAELLNKLRLELKKYNIDINKIFFVGNNLHGNYHIKKTFILLEHLIGLKIKNDRFVSLKQDWYKKVHFYDDDPKNIDTANNAQKYLEELLRNTDDELVKIILSRINDFNLILKTYLITNNEINRFKIDSITLNPPIRFPIKESLKKYKNWLQK